MARIRYISPAFFMDENVSELPADAQLLFIGLWCLADREGRLEDRPRFIKANVFPYRDVEVEPLLVLLASRRFVIRYEVEGRSLLAIRSFGKHQNPHHKEKPSSLPAPPPTAMLEPSMVQACLKHASSMREEPPCLPQASGKQGGSSHGNGNGNGNGNGEGSMAVLGASTAAPAQPELVAVPPKPKRTTQTGDFHDWCMGKRAAALPSTAPRDDKPTEHVWAALGEMLRDYGRKVSEAAWLAFMGEEYARRANFPMRLFASQWGRWVTAAQKATAGPPTDVRRGVVRAEDALLRMEPPGEVKL